MDDVAGTVAELSAEERTKARLQIAATLAAAWYGSHTTASAIDAVNKTTEIYRALLQGGY